MEHFQWSDILYYISHLRLWLSTKLPLVALLHIFIVFFMLSQNANYYTIVKFTFALRYFLTEFAQFKRILKLQPHVLCLSNGVVWQRYNICDLGTPYFKVKKAVILNPTLATILSHFFCVAQNWYFLKILIHGKTGSHKALFT